MELLIFIFPVDTGRAHKYEKAFNSMHLLHTEDADIIFRWSLKVRELETNTAKSDREFMLS